MTYLPEDIRRIVDHFDRLPGIGPKHATRLALYLLRNKDFAKKFAEDLTHALDSAQLCGQCKNLSNTPLCSMCSDPNRDQSSICVVAHVQDIEPMEHTGKYNGTYHVLHGTLNPVEGVTPDDITIGYLIKRIQAGGVSEVILALDATTAGEATAIYLKKQLMNESVNVTRLARGIPVGSSIEYTDEVTLSSALENRK